MGLVLIDLLFSVLSFVDPLDNYIARRVTAYAYHFPIENFPFICSNIPTAQAYGAYVCKLMRYSRACSS